MEKAEQVTIRIPKELRKVLKAIAAKQQRTMVGMLRYMLAKEVSNGN